MFKKITYLLAAIVLLTSCATQKRCNKLYPPQIIVKDSFIQVVKDSIIIKDSLITIPGQTITLTEYFRDTLVFIDTIIQQGNLSLQVKAHKGKLTATCKADSLQKLVQMLRRQLLTITNNTTKQTTTVQAIPTPKPYIPKWVWYSLVINIIAAAYIFRKQLTNILKTFL